MKQKLLNKLWLRVGMIVAIMTTALSGTAWAQTTYALQQVTSVEAGGMYVFEQQGYVMSNACSNSALQTTNTYNTTGLAGTETYVWTLEEATGGFYMKNSNGTGASPYLNNTSSTNISFGNSKSSVWEFNFQSDNTALIQNKNNSNRFLGYTTSTSHAYKAYATSNLSSYPHAIKVYQLVVEEGGSTAVATTTTIDASGITNTDVYKSTSAGSLSASVTADDNAVAGATVSWSSSDTDVATIASDGTVTLVSAGSVTFTASYKDVSGEYQASYDTYEMTVTSSAPDYVTLPFEWSGGVKDDLTALVGVTANGLGSDYAEGNAPYRVKFDTTGDYIQVKTDSQPGKVTIGVKMLGGATASSITVQESATGENFTKVQVLSISGNSNAELTLETTNDFAATTRYIRLYFTKGSNVGVGPISIAKPSTDPVISAEDASINYNTTSGSINYEIVHPVEGGTISASTDAAWLTFGSTGTAFTAEENTNISARVANVTLTYTYNTSQTVTKEITLTQGGDPNAPGTESNPYTVAQARAALDAGVGVEGVYATGIVSEIVTAYNSQYGNISYNISADGLTTSDQLEIYRGKSFNGDNFTSENDIQVGDEVVVYGNLTTHGETYEFAQDNQLVSLTRAKQDPTIPSTPVSVVYGSTHTVTGIVGGDITVTSSNTAVATVEGLVITPKAVGTTTITVITEENTYYNAGSGTFELTVTAPVGGTEAPTGSAGGTIFEETFAGCTEAGGNDGNFATASNTEISTADDFTDNDDWSLTKGYPAKGCLKFGGSKASGGAITPSITATIGTTYTLSFKAAPWNTESTTMNVSVDGGTISGLSEVAMSTGEWNDFTASITATATSFTVTFGASNNRFFLDEVKVEAPASPAPAITATLNGSGYATFCSEYPLDFSGATDFSAWQITGVSGETITFSQITGSIKGGQGILLKGTAGKTIELTSANSTTTLSGNLLEGTLAPTYVANNEYYGLSGENFVKVNAGTVPAGKAILNADEPNSVKPFTFVFEGANGIETIENISRKEVEAIFNLTGQRTSRPTRGINIINGKKVLVR